MCPQRINTAGNNVRKTKFEVKGKGSLHMPLYSTGEDFDPRFPFLQQCLEIAGLNLPLKK
jgi:hypothetical protein